MNNIFRTAMAAAVALAAVSCANRSNPVVANFAIDETIKSASQTFMGVEEGDTVYCTLSTSVPWPEKLGEHSLRTLQDSLIAKLYGASELKGPKGIDGAIRRFVDTPSIFETGSEMVLVDSMPEVSEQMMSLYLDVTAKVLDMNENVVTYQVTRTSYTGGAHPNTSSDIFSYDLEAGEVLTGVKMFVAGSEADLLSAIRQALAFQLGVEDPNKLEEAGIFTSQLTDPGQPYLLGDAVVFHYNPYEIAPYAMGAIEVSIWAPEIENLLTPRMAALLFN